MASSQLKLGYWKVRGFGEPARTLLEYLEIPYEEENYDTLQDWLAVKAQSTHLFPNLPYVKDGEKTVTESQAVYTYLCLKGNKPEMTGKPEDKVEFTQLQTILLEVHDNITKPAYNSPDIESFKKAIDGFKSFYGSYKFGGLNEILGKREWLLGNLTFLDFFFAECCEKFLAMDKDLGTGLLTDYPNIVAHNKRFAELPAIKAYRQSERFKKYPFNNPNFNPVWK